MFINLFIFSYDVNFLQSTWAVITNALTLGISKHFAHPHHAKRGGLVGDDPLYYLNYI